MRIGRRRLGATIAGLLAIVVLALGAAGYLRRKAAGVARVIAPPAGATTYVPTGSDDDGVVGDRAGIIARSLRNDRGAATVRTYSLSPETPWLQARKSVATQLDHWEQIGACTDTLEARIVECAWREPTRWWPREVQLTLMRPSRDSDATFLIIGAAPGS